MFAWFSKLLSGIKKMPIVKPLSKSSTFKALKNSMPAVRLGAVSLVEKSPEAIALTNEAVAEFAEKSLRNR